MLARPSDPPVDTDPNEERWALDRRERELVALLGGFGHRPALPDLPENRFPERHGAAQARSEFALVKIESALRLLARPRTPSAKEAHEKLSEAAVLLAATVADSNSHDTTTCAVMRQRVAILERAVAERAQAERTAHDMAHAGGAS